MMLWRDYFGFPWMMIGIILCLALVIAIVYLFQIPMRQTNRHDADHPLEILKERYARGEIDTEEYQRMKEDLR